MDNFAQELLQANSVLQNLPFSYKQDLVVKCSDCDAEFQNLRGLRLHEGRIHNVSDKNMQCCECSKLLKEKLETILTQHKDSFTTMKNLEILAPKPETNVKPKKNIHNRLYMDSKYTKRLTKKPSQPVFSKKSPSNINYGNLLYEKSKATLNSK